MNRFVFVILFLAGISGLSAFGQSPVAVDNSYMDWQGLPPITVFSSHFNPVYFTRELKGQSQDLVIEKSIYWQTAGTRITEVKAYMDTENVFLSLQCNGNFAADLSIFLYLYPNRDPEQVNSFTVELVPRQGGGDGAVLLWERGKSIPLAFGKLKNSSFRLECSLPISDLPKSLIVGTIEELSVDLTTCYHEPSSGLYEEFFFTTVFFKDFLLPQDL